MNLRRLAQGKSKKGKDKKKLSLENNLEITKRRKRKNTYRIKALVRKIEILT